MISILISTISGLVFAITYLLSPYDKAPEYSAIALTIALICEMVIKHYCIHKLKKHNLAIYGLIFCFTIPTIIYNNIIFIQYKFYLFKIFFFIYVIYAQFKLKFNLMQFCFNKILRKISDKGWTILNLSFAGYLLSSIAFALIAQYVFGDKGWVIYKGILLPLWGGVFFVYMIIYGIIDYLYHSKQATNSLPKSIEEN